MKKQALILLFSLLSLGSRAYHIVGGEIIYDYIGNDNYQITLKIYRDCGAINAAPFDGTGIAGQAFITVYDASNNLVGVYDIGTPTITPVPPAFNNPCIKAPTGTCIEEGRYEYVLNLPPQMGGYTIVYQRCCRNTGIVNLFNSNTAGSSYYTKIPGPEDAVDNSSPRFTNFPPIYICNNVNFQFDHSATDPDGDQLVYSLCAPYTGLDACCPALGTAVSNDPQCVSPPTSCPGQAPPPPYSNVQFVSPYSGSYPIASNPAFSINPTTGQLSGTPNLIGQYVVGVCIQEFRNSQLINTHFRDFQFTVVVCTVAVQSLVADQSQKCQGQTITFNNQSINNSPSPIYHWDFGVPNLLSDTSNLASPVYFYPDTGIYTITLISNPGKACTDTLKKKIYVYPPLDINFEQPDPQCLKGNSFSFKTKGAYLPQTTYSWDFTPFATPSVSVVKDPAGIQFLQSGLFLVTLKAMQFACRDSFTDSINIIGRPKAKISSLQNGGCDPARISFSNQSSSPLPLRYKWTFSDGKTSTEFAPTHIFSPAGTYAATLVVETSQLCVDTAIATVGNLVVSPKPVAGFTISSRETSIFEPEISIGNTSASSPVTVIFEFGDGQGSTDAQTLHTYADFGTYTITQTLVNYYGCEDKTSDVVVIQPEFRFWTPNAFTPDGNQCNDLFLPVSVGVTDYQFEIFDRWGAEIFKTNSSKEGWNGSYKGAACAQGVYNWKASFKNVVSNKVESYQGHVTLLRSE